MGGKALTDTPTRRLAASEFHDLAASLPPRLASRLGARVEPIPAYRAKPDFGDLDLLVDADALERRFGEAWPAALESAARDLSHARQFVPNGARRNERFLIDTTTVSYDHRADPSLREGFQVDIILTRADTFDASKGYYAYNDLGNLVGRVGHRLGFVYGHRGLLYPLRKNDTHLIAMLEVTRDTDAALAFMGYDAARFRRGFDTLDEVFAYTASSPYFHRDIYLLENRNHHARMRDRKRATYAAFLKAITVHDEWPNHPVPAPEDTLSRAFATFPLFQQAYENALTAVPAKSATRRLFSGSNVQAWTGLDIQEVALLMERVRLGFPDPQAFSAFVEAAGEAGLKERVQAALAVGPLAPPRRRKP